MLKKLLKNKLRIASVILLIVALALVRAFESNLFYDPFLTYFQSEYANLPIPEINHIQLVIGLFFRYFLNTVLSLAMIYVLFKDVDAVKFAAVLYSVFFVFLLVALLFVLLKDGETHKMGLFYVRRFLIQPIFLLLFIPAFYLQNQKKDGFE